MTPQEIRCAFEEAKPQLINLATRFVGEDLAEDMVQDAFVKAIRKSAQFRGESKASTWIYRIVVNTCLNHIKGSKRRDAYVHIPIEEAYDVPDGATPEELVSASQIGSLVEEVLRRMPKKMRAVMEARYSEGMAYEDIATHFRMPIGTVRSALFRARNLITTALQKGRPPRRIGRDQKETVDCSENSVL